MPNFQHHTNRIDYLLFCKYPTIVSLQIITFTNYKNN